MHRVDQYGFGQFGQQLSIQAKTVEEGDHLSAYRASCSDPETDYLTFFIANLPATALEIRKTAGVYFLFLCLDVSSNILISLPSDGWVNDECVRTAVLDCD